MEATENKFYVKSLYNNKLYEAKDGSHLGVIFVRELNTPLGSHWDTRLVPEFWMEFKESPMGNILYVKS